MSSGVYFTYKGILLPVRELKEETVKYVENEFQVRDDDIFNVTYPKSGTNWMSEILGLIRNDGDPSWIRSLTVFDRTPWIETDHGLETALKYPPPRLISTHLQIQLFPKSFFHSKAKVIYTLRNPKDVLVSHYHFSKIFKLWKDLGTMEELLKDFLSGNVPFGSWFDHVKGWLPMKDRDNVFFITYEELQQDLRGSVERICHFLGKELNSQQIDSVVENASFQKMKDNKMSNFTIVGESYIDHEKGKLLRKGISGDWKNHLTVAQSELFDHVYQENMRGVSMTFPWD
ncbi:PREDICTED: sulfotransferase family cytosolic 2B member 1-like [Gekko japonicus]|uniref:Sulfotransferase n=1 Tax=Gekko japonicus TaxID=146911 RepID=A0ABM1KIX9_GEKJA|nr:PREDICTED: sulfotransferase family cytosolic 2B member 1-like [Gekko japonicus]